MICKTVTFISIIALMFVFKGHAQVDSPYVLVGDDEFSGKAWLGVQIQDLSRSLKKSLKTGANYGAVVEEVTDDSPASESGIEPGDVIIKFGKKTIRDADDLIDEVKTSKPGDKVEVQFFRGSNKLNKSVTLESRKSDLTIAIPKIPKLPAIPRFGAIFPNEQQGMELQELNEDLASYFDVPADGGALVTDVDRDSPADKAGLKAGDVITHFDGEPIDSIADFQKLIQERDEEETVQLDFVRKGNRQSTSLKIQPESEGKGFYWRHPGKKDSLHHFLWRDENGKDKIRVRLFDEDLKERIKADIDLHRDHLAKEMDILKQEMKKLKEELKELKENK